MSPSGGRDLIDTRKRRRYSSPHPVATLSPASDAPLKKTPRRWPVDHELRGIVRGFHIPEPIFNRVESRMVELKAAADRAIEGASDANGIAAARGLEISKRCQQIHDLKTDLSRTEKENNRLMSRLTGQEKTIELYRAQFERRANDSKELKRVQEEKADLEAFALTKDQLLETGASAVRDQRMQVAKTSSENAALRQTLEDREAHIGKLNDLLTQMEFASSSGDDMTGLALEAQAQQTLGLVQGLKADIAAKDEEIEGLQAQVFDCEQEIESRIKKTEEQGKALRDLEKKVKVAEGRARETQAVAEEQDVLIKRILSENERLQGP